MLENFYRDLLSGNKFSYMIGDDNEIFGAVMIGGNSNEARYFHKIKLSFH